MLIQAGEVLQLRVTQHLSLEKLMGVLLGTSQLCNSVRNLNKRDVET